MSLSDLASLGSFLSGLAVATSLVALIFQVRQNTTMMARVESNATMDQMSAIRMSIASNRDMARVWDAGLKGHSDLDELDQLRFRTFFSNYVVAFAHIYDRHKRVWGQSSSFERGPGRFLVKQVLSTDGGSAWWAENSSDMYAFPEFVKTIDGLRNELKAEQLKDSSVDLSNGDR